MWRHWRNVFCLHVVTQWDAPFEFRFSRMRMLFSKSKWKPDFLARWISLPACFETYWSASRQHYMPQYNTCVSVQENGLKRKTSPGSALGKPARFSVGGSGGGCTLGGRGEGGGWGGGGPGGKEGRGKKADELQQSTPPFRDQPTLQASLSGTLPPRREKGCRKRVPRVWDHPSLGSTAAARQQQTASRRGLRVPLALVPEWLTLADRPSISASPPPSRQWCRLPLGVRGRDMAGVFAPLESVRSLENCCLP